MRAQNNNNGLVWPAWVDKILFYQLASGTRLSAVSENMAINAKSFDKNVIITLLPRTSCIYTCSIKIRISCEGIAVCILAKASEWKQLFTDDTSKSQTSTASLVLKIKEGKEYNIVALSAH